MASSYIVVNWEEKIIMRKVLDCFYAHAYYIEYTCENWNFFI